MAKEVKESPNDVQTVSDLLANTEKSLMNVNNIKETGVNMSWSAIKMEGVPIEVKNVETKQVKEDLNLKELEELITKDTMLTIDVDTTDKRQQRAIANQRNTYAAKKTVAQGMMDVALITANANQLRYLIEYQRKSPTFYVNVFLIVCSLLLQIAVGISLIFKGRFDMKGESKSLGARRINNYVVVGVFLTTIINVFVAAFSISSPELPSISSTTFAG